MSSNNRSSIDNKSPAGMLTSMTGNVVGLAGMALLGFGALCFIQFLVNAVLLVIPCMVTEKNPWEEFTKIISIQKLIYYAASILIGTLLRKTSGFLCSDDTLRSIDNFFYRRD